MSTATLPLDAARAAADRDYYDHLIDKADGNTHKQVENAVTAYTATHPASPAPVRPLDYVEQQILKFEKRHFPNPGRKEQAIRDEFGYSTTRYYQRLNTLIDDPAALATAPQLVNRLRRLREQRRGLRRNPAGSTR